VLASLICLFRFNPTHFSIPKKNPNLFSLSLQPFPTSGKPFTSEDTQVPTTHSLSTALGEIIPNPFILTFRPPISPETLSSRLEKRKEKRRRKKDTTTREPQRFLPLGVSLFLVALLGSTQPCFIFPKCHAILLALLLPKVVKVSRTSLLLVLVEEGSLWTMMKNLKNHFLLPVRVEGPKGLMKHPKRKKNGWLLQGKQEKIK
jgi:hypothetical protein